MKTMYKIYIYLPLLALIACATEESPVFDSPVDNDSPKIVVMGGSTAPGTTRADEWPPNEPDKLGICNANKLRILHFREAVYGTAIDPEELQLINFDEGSKTQLDIDLINQLNYRDKWANQNVTLDFTGSRTTGHAFPAIAYTDEGIETFELSTSEGYIKTTLNLKKAESTPELYFGRLKPISNEKNKSLTYSNFDQEGVAYHYYAGNTKISCLLEGKLYRIVSQLNINISEVSPNVEKIEMYLSNVPTKIGLYAKHRTASGQEGNDRGYFYPIVEAAGDGQHSMKETLVCTVENKDSTEWTAKLSTFILPSDRGRSVTLKAYIKTVDDEEKPEEAIDENEEENEETSDENDRKKYKIIERSRLLRASQNYYLTEETSKVYYSSTDLPVYKAASNEFMSYPNIRVNVSGSFSDIFSEESESNVQIEICPNYDGEHKITI